MRSPTPSFFHLFKIQRPSQHFIIIASQNMPISSHLLPNPGRSIQSIFQTQHSSSLLLFSINLNSTYCYYHCFSSSQNCHLILQTPVSLPYSITDLIQLELYFLSFLTKPFLYKATATFFQTFSIQFSFLLTPLLHFHYWYSTCPPSNKNSLQTRSGQKMIFVYLVLLLSQRIAYKQNLLPELWSLSIFEHPA